MLDNGHAVPYQWMGTHHNTMFAVYLGMQHAYPTSTVNAIWEQQRSFLYLPSLHLEPFLKRTIICRWKSKVQFEPMNFQNLSVKYRSRSRNAADTCRTISKLRVVDYRRQQAERAFTDSAQHSILYRLTYKSCSWHANAHNLSGEQRTYNSWFWLSWHFHSLHYDESINQHYGCFNS